MGAALADYEDDLNADPPARRTPCKPPLSTTGLGPLFLWRRSSFRNAQAALHNWEPNHYELSLAPAMSCH